MSKSEHLLIARQGPLAIARWREQHAGERLDFSGGILSNHNLSRADLSEADLRGADLIGARLNQANLRHADLRDAVPLMAYLSDADLSDANLEGATLRRADLSRSTLSGAKLGRANLSGANLTSANLSNVDLTGANLSGANLTGCSLHGADLSRADLNNADLSGADLTGSNLGKATFYRSSLEGTVFKDAVMFHTLFGDCDMRGATGLEEVNHAGPSTVGIDAIFRSGGLIPESFLRGTGVPEGAVAEYTASGDQGPGRFYTCFISYCTKDEAFTQRLQSDLQARGVRCWHFAADSRAGQWVAEHVTTDELGLWIAEDVDRGIHYYDKLIVVCSGDSLAAERVREEITHGMQKQEESGRWLFFPVAVTDEPYNRRNRHVRGLGLARHSMFDFRGWQEPSIYEATLEALAADLGEDRDASVGMAPVEEDED